MTTEEKIEKLRVMPQAYVLYSLFTRMPYVECEQNTFYDQAFLFESREDAEEAARRLCANGDIVGVTELKVVEMTPPTDPKLGEPVRKLMRSQVREHLMRFPLLGLNAVFFKPAGERGEVLPLDDVLPEQVKSQMEKEKTDRIGVQLTGLYFAQYIRRKEKDPARLREHYEEFYANLARVKMLLPVIPDEDAQQADGSLNLTKCQLPVFTPGKKEGEQEQGTEQSAEQEKIAALALFTNMDEVVMHSRNNIQKVRVVEVGLEEVPKFVPEPIKYVVVDPLTLSITIRVEDIMKIINELK